MELHVFTESEINSERQVKQIEKSVKKRRLQEEMSKLQDKHPRKILQNKENGSGTSHSSAVIPGMSIA